MKTRIEWAKNWLEERSERERIYIFMFGFVLIYIFFYLIFLRPLTKQKLILASSINTLKTEQTALQQQIEQIKSNTKMPIFLQMLQQYKKLSTQINLLDQQIAQYKIDLFSPDSLANLSKQILQVQSSDAALVSLKEFPVETWPPKEKLEKNNLLSTITPGYQHTLQIEFKNDFFDTIRYLIAIEKLSKHIYWDRMEYKVVQYPKANVVIQLHLLTVQKSG